MTDPTTNRALMERVVALFEQAAALSDERQRQFVEALRRDEPDVAAELGSLLAAREPDGDFLEPMDVGRVAAAYGVGRETDLRGTLIGAYRIERELGRGGMGVVYVAERADGQFDQQVALKLIKRGMDSDEIQRRFLTERQILASLSHPNIARLLDGGVTDDGQPYFAMEYVQGTPLTEYCDTHRLTLRERLAHFAQVCRAVQHAHANLVVHRDLKPSNILVTDDGQIKLLDFGIAKLLDPSLASGQTATALRPLTPEYASPEQVRGDTVTTASDVYQLGLLLYRLLTGLVAYRLDPSSLAKALSTVCETMPTRPSLAISQEPDANVDKPDAQVIASARRTTPPRLARALAGDLDNIVLMALRKEPQRRYASAEQFAMEIARFLEDQPVIARRDTWRYRTSKFLKRHGLAVGAGLAASIAFLLLIGFYTLRLQAERERVEAEAAKATRVAEFMTDLFKTASPVRLDKEQLSARELLDRGADKVAVDLAEEPDVQAHMMHVLGVVYDALERRDKARTLLEQAVTLREELLGPRHPDVARSLFALGRTLYFLADYDAARPVLERAAAIQEEVLGPAHIDLAETLGRLFMLHGRLDDMERAEAMFERAVAVSEKALGPDHPATAKHLNNFALLIRSSDEVRARDLYQRVVEIDEKALGPDHVYTAKALANLTALRRRMGDLVGLETQYRRAETIYLDKLPGSIALASLYVDWALYYESVELPDKARATFEKSIATHEMGVNGGEPDVAYAYALLGNLLADTGEFTRAIELHERALAVREKHFGPDHSLVAYSLELMAKALTQAGDYDQAESRIERALAIYRDNVAPNDFRFARAWTTRADLSAALGLHEAAESAYRLALTAISSGREPDFAGAAHARRRLANALVTLGRFAEAEPLLLDSYQVLQDQPASERRQALDGLVALYDAWGQSAEAIRYRALIDAER